MILKSKVTEAIAVQSPQESKVDWKLSWIVSLSGQFETEKQHLKVENFAELEQQAKILPSSEWQSWRLNMLLLSIILALGIVVERSQ